jgi:hypothetical protein
MSDRKFEFDLYRLNVVDNEDEYSGTPITTNMQIMAVLKQMTISTYDIGVTGKKSSVSWGFRQFDQFASSTGQAVYRLILAKSVEEQEGDTVTDDGIEAGRSEINPPLAISVALMFFEERHLVAIEHNSSLTGGQAWHRAFRKISDNSAKSLGLTSFLALNPVPEKNSLLDTLKSFSRLFRMRTKIRLPNPELTRYTKELFEQLKSGAIREYRQDMRNRQEGLNTQEGSLVHSSVALAESGYNDGDLVLIGVRSTGKVEKVIVGKSAARSRISLTKEQVRTLTPKDPFLLGLHPIDELIAEINRLHPIDESVNG